MHPLKKQNRSSLLHCGILTVILGFLLLLIALTHPGCVYGSQTDWSNQHFAIPEYFRTRFYATGNLFPNFAMHLGGGQNIYHLAYYGLYSPVILLSFLFPWMSMAAYLQCASILLTWLSAVLCYFWLCKWFPKRHALFLSVLFLLAAPVLYHSHHHIMFVNYFPFLFWALQSVHRALESRWSIGLLLSMVCILLTSFYFSVGASCAIFLYGIFLTLHQNPHQPCRQALRAAGILLLHLLLSLLIAAFFLLPTAWTLLHGRDPSDNSISLWKLFLPGIHSDYFTYSPFSIGMTSVSILAVIALLLVPRRSSRFLAGSFAALLLFPVILYLMNGTMYLDAKAYIPLLPLLLLTCGTFFQALSKRQVPLQKTLLLFAAAIGFALLTQDSTTSQRLGLLLDGSCMVLCLFLYCRKQQMLFLTIPTICFSAAVCLAVNFAGETYMQKKDVDAMYSQDIQTLTTKLADTDNSFYRISNEFHAGDTVNRIWNSHFYRSSIYSSVQNASFTDFCFRQVHNENSIRNAAMLVQTKNPIFSMLMGEKYLLSEKPVTRYGMKQIGQSGNIRLYENTLAFPIGFATSHIMPQEALQQLSYPEKLEALLKNAVVTAKDLEKPSGSDPQQPEGVREITPQYTVTGVSKEQITDVGEGYYVHSKEPFSVTVTLKQPIHAMLLLKFSVNNHLGNGSTTGDVSITVNGIRNKLTDPQWKYQNHNFTFHYTLSSNAPIQTLKIHFSAGDYVISDGTFYTMDYSTLEQAAADIDPWELRQDTLGDDTMEGTIQVRNNGWFVLSMPYDEGFRITVDGTETAYYPTDSDLIGFPIDAGSHHIRITYTAPGAKPGQYISAAGIVLALLWILGCCFLEERKMIQRFTGFLSVRSRR